jgi:hypothetical protein
LLAILSHPPCHEAGPILFDYRQRRTTDRGYSLGKHKIGSTIELCYSLSQEARFPPTQLIGDTEYSTWTNGEPGQFIIGYGGYNPANAINEVTRIVMGLGNNP